MIPMGELFDFVKSLSKTERRYFKVDLGERSKSKAYMELYDLLDGFSVFGIEERGILLEHFKPQQLEIARKHLFKVLMRVLGKYHLSTDTESMLWERYTEARMLLKKGFFEAGMRHIEQGKAAALKAGVLQFQTLFSRLELSCGVEQKFSGWTEDRLISVHQSIRENRKEERAVDEHASLYELLLCRYWKYGTARNHLQRAQLNDLVLEEHQIVSNHRKETFGSAQLHLHFQSVYFMMTGDQEGSLKAFYALDALFQKHNTEWTSNPGAYVRFLQDVLDTLRRFELFEEMDHFFSRMEELKFTAETDKSRIALLLAEHRLHISLAKADASFVLPEETLKNSWEDSLLLHETMQWYFTVARAHLAREEYGEALRIVNRLFQIPQKVTGRINSSKIRILNLMVHHALQDREYLFYEIRSFERKMKKEGSWHHTERLVVDYLKHWIVFKPYSKSRDEMIRLLEDPYEQVMVSELGLKKWLKLKS